MNKLNISSAYDVAILVTECMKLEIFRKVVSTKVFQTKALAGSPKDGSGAVTQYHWENSNKLLGKCPGIMGCKTGITNAAGPCFAGYYESKCGETKLAIILLHSISMESRWIEVTALVNWYQDYKRAKDQRDRKQRSKLYAQKMAYENS